MDVFLYILLGLITLRLLVTLVNYSFRPYLPTIRRIKDAPMVSLLINGDMDQARMRHILDLLSRVYYPSLEIIVGIYNPQHMPVEQILQVARSDKRIRILEINQLQRGWREDNQINSILGREAHGSYLLFMDANVELRGGILEILVSYMKDAKIGLMSVFPSFEVHSKAEWLTFPILNQLYLSLYLLRRMHYSQRPRASLASDKFMLFEGEVYRQFQPFEEVRSGRDEARKIAEYLKSESISIDWRIGDRRVRLLGSVSWKQCVVDLSQELPHFFGRFYLLGFVYGVVMCMWWIPFVLTGSWLLLLLGIAETLVTQAVLASITRVSVRKNILYFFPQMVVLLGVLWISLLHRIHVGRRMHCRKCQL